MLSSACLAPMPTGFGYGCAVDDGAAIGERRVQTEAWMNVMMRIGSAAIGVALAGALLLPAAAASAQTASPAARMAQASPEDVQPPAPHRVRRPLRRLPIYPRYQPEPDAVYPRYYPGPDAVRECTATYVQEFRPSGTVIVPRMSCFWRRG
jgi:hypothetical protein